MIHELKNPVVKTLLNHLRDTKTDALRFRHIIHELTRLLVYEALANEPMEEREIETWQGKESFSFLREKDLLFVTVLRAGLPMLETAVSIFPEAEAGFLAMKRDEETHQSVLYYDRLAENCEGRTVIIVDPMVATGGSLCDAIALVKDRSPKKILSLNLIGAPEGLEIIKQKHPDVELYIAQIDTKLNEDKFILPGLGDAGDRSYNTPA